MAQSSVFRLPRLSAGRLRRTSYLVKRLETLVRVRLEAALRAYGITSGQYMLLSLVSREGGLSSAALARRTSVTPQSMNEQISALEHKALIDRTEHPENRRVLHVAPTLEGRRLVASCERLVDDVESELFRTLSAQRLEDFRSSIELVLEAAQHSGAL